MSNDRAKLDKYAAQIQLRPKNTVMIGRCDLGHVHAACTNKIVLSTQRIAESSNNDLQVLAGIKTREPTETRENVPDCETGYVESDDKFELSYVAGNNEDAENEVLTTDVEYDEDNEPNVPLKSVQGGKITYFCLIDQINFKSYRRLDDHIREMHSETDDIYWPCKIESCSRYFHNKTTYRHHLKSKHAQDDRSITRIMAARRREKQQRVLRCKICNCYFDNNFDLRDHLTTHQTTRLRACPKKDCQEKFQNYNTYKSHIRRRHPELKRK